MRLTSTLRLAAAIGAAAFTASACADHQATETVEPASVTLHLNASGDASGVSVQFIRVDNDSRCASDVTCIWAGNALVVITVRTPGTPPMALLAQQFVNTNVEPRQVDVSGYRVHLDSLTPYPSVAHPIEPQSYVAYLTVSKTQ